MKFFISILIFSLIFGLIQWMFYRSLTRFELSKMLKVSILIFTILAYAFAIIQMIRVGTTSHAFTYYSAFFLLIFVPQLVHLLFGILSEFWIGSERLIFKEMNPSRRKFLGQISLGLSAIPFIGLLHGIFIGKYAFKRHRHELYFDNLPLAFDNYKIVHISDIHCGSLDDKSAIADAVELINAEEADLVLFTGDLVNHEAKEVDEWETILKKIQSKTGKYAVLGNHDYSPYSKTSAEEKVAELEKVKAKYKAIHFDLLNNQNVALWRGEEKIDLIGVEYWGNTMQHQPGDLEKAIEHVDPKQFKILMSHDPSHIEKVAFSHKMPFELSLSGHTHGFQFGIEIPGWFQWSPVQYVYKYWAGMYQKDGQFLNVNRGFGYHAYSGRTGIWPEISVLTLKKNSAKV